MAKSVAGLVVFALLFGFTSGAYVSTMPACIAVMTTDMSEIGVSNRPCESPRLCRAELSWFWTCCAGADRDGVLGHLGGGVGRQ
jgi:hypothetical protein